jgi:hypothetical protein
MAWASQVANAIPLVPGNSEEQDQDQDHDHDQDQDCNILILILILILIDEQGRGEFIRQ